MSHWTIDAEELVKPFIGKEIPEDAHMARIAAEALLRDLEGHGHPSYLTTAFAVAATIPYESKMAFYAFCLVVNGLVGYFQWETHNGGKFSVLDTLVNLGIMTDKEAEHPEQFQVRCTHDRCLYYLIHKDLLKRIIWKFKLPFGPNLGGETLEDRKEIIRASRRLNLYFDRYPQGSDENAQRRFASLRREQLDE